MGKGDGYVYMEEEGEERWRLQEKKDEKFVKVGRTVGKDAGKETREEKNTQKWDSGRDGKRKREYS